jgi:hypothetical protein
MADQGGGIEHRAPEILLGRGTPDLPADVWSFGLFLFAVLSGKEPFLARGKTEHMRALSGKRERLVIPALIPEPLKKLMKIGWEMGASLRPRFAEIVAQMENEKFLEGVDRDALVAFKARVDARSAAN